ncbi:hypothetical protein CHELA40_13316 [Chelatococcus asaccharovorans]|nr:hypothetical protein CHELA40_13316 [Chelatococcus asaccharovorans]
MSGAATAVKPAVPIMLAPMAKAQTIVFVIAISPGIRAPVRYGDGCWPPLRNQRVCREWV